jgi:tetratricopeptide (TPR) repeat protein
MQARDQHDRWDAVEEGAELLREGSTQAAIAELQRVLREDPDNEYAHHYLGAAHYEQAEYTQALRCYLRAAELAPRYGAAWVGVGHTLRMMGQHGEAIRVGKQLLAQEPDSPDGLHLLGLCHYALGDDEEAAAYLERFLGTRPEFEVAMEVDGILKLLRGQVTVTDDEMSEQ